MNKLDLSKTLKKYKNGWVAISKDYKEVLFSAPNFNALMNKIDRPGKKDNVILIPASENYRGFIG
jgi:hypothetical protein